MSIKRIFFDSGEVLVRPRSGSWFYPQDYFDWIKEKKVPHFSIRQRMNEKKAVTKLLDRKFVRNNIEEYDLFLDFYSEVFSNVWKKDSQELIQLCAKGKVYDNNEQVMFSDVEQTLNTLSGKFELSIISDAWPSLKQKYASLGIIHHFEPFIISTLHGADKSGLDLFKKTLMLVDEKPEECLFIDDRLDNLRRAASLGINCVHCSRYKKPRKSEFVSIKDFNTFDLVLKQ